MHSNFYTRPFRNVGLLYFGHFCIRNFWYFKSFPFRTFLWFLLRETEITSLIPLINQIQKCIHYKNPHFNLQHFGQLNKVRYSTLNSRRWAFSNFDCRMILWVIFIDIDATFWFFLKLTNNFKNPFATCQSSYFRFHSMTLVHFSQQLVTTTFCIIFVFGSALCMSNFHTETFWNKVIQMLWSESGA